MRRIPIAVACAALFAAPAIAQPVDGTFSYQGRLTTAGAPYTGNADINFYLYDAAAGGTQIGPIIGFGAVPVNDGLFNVDLDFGVAALDGNRRWLEIEARTPAGVGSYVGLGRQEIRGTPYAIQTRGMHVDSALNIGVDTTNPAVRLHVGGSEASLLVRNPAQESGVMLDGTGVPYAPLGLVTPFRSRHSAATASPGIGTALTEYPEGHLLRMMNVVTARETAFIGTVSSTHDGGMALFANNGANTALLWADDDFDPNNGASGMFQLSSTNGGQGGLLRLLNDDAAQTALLAGGATSEPASFRLFDPTDATETVGIWGMSGGEGGAMYTYSETGNTQIVLEPDFHGEGTFFSLARDDLNGGLVFDGNALGTGNPWVLIDGASRSVVFDTTVPADNSVIVPGESISDIEILDEPGVASDALDTNIALTGGFDNILSRTISCPTSGYCLVIGTLTPIFGHTTGASSLASFGVSDTSGTIPTTQYDTDIEFHGNAASGVYSFPVTAHGVFDVTPGSHTFYLVAKEWFGDFAVDDPSLAVLFVPTAYGTVTPTAATARADKSEPSPSGAPMTLTDIKGEQALSMAADLARRDTELAAYRLQLDELRTRLEAVEQQQGVHDRPPPASPPASGSKAAR